MCHCQLGSMEMKSTSLLFIFKQSQFLGDSMRCGRRVSPPFQTFLFKKSKLVWVYGPLETSYVPNHHSRGRGLSFIFLGMSYLGTVLSKAWAGPVGRANLCLGDLGSSPRQSPIWSHAGEGLVCGCCSASFKESSIPPPLTGTDISD